MQFAGKPKEGAEKFYLSIQIARDATLITYSKWPIYNSKL